jgi:trans-2,3-dihydro-3-hydroxyanthranilate isomerase
MSDLDFYIVDVFAIPAGTAQPIDKYSGNQLAVFPNAGELASAEMQQIAREINFSESTFITGSPRAGAYPVKIFTPKVELPFAGHPTLGTAWVIQQQLGQPVAMVELEYTAGRIPVRFDSAPGQPQVLWMEQRSAEFCGDLLAAQLAPVLQIDPADIDASYPISQVSTGLPFIIVPLKSLAAVQKAQLQLDAYYQLIAGLQAQSILIFCAQTLQPENHLHVRVFTHALGIPEDPATGSANGCLAAYLVRNGYQGQRSINWQVEQGYEIDRPALLYLRADPTKVEVGGRVVLVASGRWHR